MEPVAVALIVVSAFLHAGWNFHGKSRNPSAAFFLVATAAGTLVLTPLLLLFHAELAAIPVKAWCLLVLTGFFLAVYYTGLATAYRLGDMSLAYPLARSTPIIFATIVTLTFGGWRDSARRRPSSSRRASASACERSDTISAAMRQSDDQRRC